jgi:zinc/manganese transport system ATP-binding protein
MSVARPEPREVGPPDAPAAVRFDRAAVTLGGRQIWSEGSFAIAPGSFVAVIGANGAGKTTLLRVILGQLRLSAGRGTVLDREPHPGNRAISLVPQRSELISGLVVRGRDLVLLGVNGHR